MPTPLAKLSSTGREISTVRRSTRRRQLPWHRQCGTVFQLAPPTQKGGAWSESLIYGFKGKSYDDGETPGGGVIFDKAGNLYGTTAYGGTGDCAALTGQRRLWRGVQTVSAEAKGRGLVRERNLQLSRAAKTAIFRTGIWSLMLHGNLYGATEFGGGKGTSCDPYFSNCGTVFELSPPKTKGGKWTEQVLHSFARGTDGANPNGGLVLDGKGAIYGTTPVGGNQLCNFGHGNVGCGILFKLTKPIKAGEAWTETILHRFTAGNDGAGPNGGLIFDAKGSLYGTAATGGDAQGYGRGFSFHASGG